MSLILSFNSGNPLIFSVHSTILSYHSVDSAIAMCPVHLAEAKIPGRTHLHIVRVIFETVFNPRLKTHPLYLHSQIDLDAFS